MSTKEPLDFTAIEAALAALVPTTGGLDRDRLMYQAGRASVLAVGDAPRFRWAWPLLTTAMMGVAAALLVVIAMRLADPTPRIVEVPATRGPTAAAAGNSLAGTATNAADDQPASPERDTLDTHHGTIMAGDPWSVVSRLVEWPTIETRGQPSLESYAALRNDLLRDGPGAWPESPSPQVPAGKSSQPATYRQMLDSLLDDSGGSKPIL